MMIIICEATQLGKMDDATFFWPSALSSDRRRAIMVFSGLRWPACLPDKLFGKQVTILSGSISLPSPSLSLSFPPLQNFLHSNRFGELNGNETEC